MMRIKRLFLLFIILICTVMFLPAQEGSVNTAVPVDDDISDDWNSDESIDKAEKAESADSEDKADTDADAESEMKKKEEVEALLIDSLKKQRTGSSDVRDRFGGPGYYLHYQFRK